MINVLVIGFGKGDLTTTMLSRNNLLADYVRKLGINVLYVNFFSKRQRERYKRLTIPISGVILGGGNVGPYSARNIKKRAPDLYKEFLGIIGKYQTVPILGICYGCHLLSQYYGGSLRPVRDITGRNKVIGQKLTHLEPTRLFEGLTDRNIYFDYNHWNYTSVLPLEARVIARTREMSTGYQFSPIHFGVNFHIMKSEDAAYQVLCNFYDICLSQPMQSDQSKLLYFLTAILASIYYFRKRR